MVQIKYQRTKRLKFSFPSQIFRCLKCNRNELFFIQSAKMSHIQGSKSQESAAGCHCFDLRETAFTLTTFRNKKRGKCELRIESGEFLEQVETEIPHISITAGRVSNTFSTESDGHAQFYRIKGGGGSMQPPPPPPPPRDNFELQILPQQTIYRWKANLMASRIHFEYWKNILISRLSQNDSEMAPEKNSNF